MLNVTNANQLYTLYEAINKIQVGKKKFTQSEIFAIMINIAIDKKIGDISWKELLEKDRKDIQNILLDNKKQLQTSVLPISMDLLAGRGKEINKLKSSIERREKLLSNENYVNKAPANIVEMDRKKLAEEQKKLAELL